MDTAQMIQRKIFLKEQALVILQGEIEDLKNELFRFQGKKETKKTCLKEVLLA